MCSIFFRVLCLSFSLFISVIENQVTGKIMLTPSNKRNERQIGTTATYFLSVSMMKKTNTRNQYSNTIE